MEVFNLDIIPGKSAPVIHASQFDAGREFKANLFEGPTVYTLSGAETLSVIVRKPDGNMVTAAVTNTSDSYITFETTEQMTACDGANLCELRIENGADVIGSINFIMEVEKSPDTGITSASEIHNLEAQVDAFTAIAVANQYDSANVIFDNAPTPGHGNGYAVTSEGVATALGTKADTSSLAAVATTGTLESLDDATIITPSANQVLAWDGSKWVNVTEYGTTFDISSGENVSIKSYIDTRNNYFINEKEVGVWIDNKKIYRCVFSGFNMSSTANTWVETTVNASNLATLINGRILDSSGQSFACSLGYSNNKVAINMPIARSNLTTLILDYTKA